MIYWIITLFLLILFIFSLIMLAKSQYYDSLVVPTISLSLAIFSLILFIIFIIISFSCSIMMANLDTNTYLFTEQREVLIHLEENYSTLMAQDLTGSESYLDVYERIIAFNNNVHKADRWKDVWWAKCVMYNPAYLNIQLIPIN